MTPVSDASFRRNEMGPRLRRYVCAALGLLALLGCKASTLSSADSLAAATSADGYVTNLSKMRVYARDPSGLIPLADLNLSINQAKLPVSLYDGPYGTRKDPSVPQPLNLLLKVYTEGFSVNGRSTGDFYFETPILFQDYEVSNVTTALSWTLQYAMDRTDFKVSKNLWDSLRQGIEVFCQDCRNKTNSEVLSLIQNNLDFHKQMESALAAENPGGAPHWRGFQDPPPLMVYTDPSIGAARAVNLTASENDKIQITAVFVDPLASTLRIPPSRWSQVGPDGETDSQTSGMTYSFRFSYQAAGTNVVTATVNGPDSTSPQVYTFDFGVSNSDQAPAWGPASLTFTANRKNTANLNAFCTDPDSGTTLSYLLVSGPPGLVVFTDGTLSWTPSQTQGGASQVGDSLITVQCTDDDTSHLSKTGQVTVHVLADHLPDFDATTPSDWNLSEGQSASITIAVNDAEGDPLVLDITDTSGIVPGLPAGSGAFTVTPLAASPNARFRVDFMPSYLQAIGSDQTVNITLSAHYDGTSGQYDGASSVVTRTLTLHVTNVDDPPQWATTPMDQNVTETVSFGPFNEGAAVDPAPNSTTVTYSLDTLPDYCGWADLTVNSATGEISGTPDITSARTCTFRLIATDVTGLSSYSSFFTYTVANTNQPVVTRTGATTSYTVTERKPLADPGTLQPIDLTTIFDDPDLDAGDTFELLTYSCLNCAALGINNLSMSSQSNQLTWTPTTGAYVNSPYALQLQATDIGGVSALVTLNITVLRGPTEVNLAASASGMNMDLDDDTSDHATSAHLTINENLAGPVTTSITLTVSPASADPIDAYPYSFNSPVSCLKVGGGSCRAGLLTAPAGTNGDGNSGPQDFVYTITPNATDGDAPLPEAHASYVVTFLVNKSDDAMLTTTFTLYLTIQNVDRPPTQIGIGNLNSVGAPYTYGTGTYSFPAIDASRDRKVGSSWQTSYKFPFDTQDPDGANDTYLYQWTSSLVPGSFTGNMWSFKLPSCLNAGTSQVTRTYTVQTSDGRGGIATRQVQLTIRNVANPPGNCL